MVRLNGCDHGQEGYVSVARDSHCASVVPSAADCVDFSRRHSESGRREMSSTGAGGVQGEGYREGGLDEVVLGRQPQPPPTALLSPSSSSRPLRPSATAVATSAIPLCSPTAVPQHEPPSPICRTPVSTPPHLYRRRTTDGVIRTSTPLSSSPSLSPSILHPMTHTSHDCFHRTRRQR